MAHDEKISELTGNDVHREPPASASAPVQVPDVATLRAMVHERQYAAGKALEQQLEADVLHAREVQEELLFEMIEAKWLFDTEPEKINIVVHPQSIIHSMVEFADGAVIAQMGHPDMREPIQYALSFPERLTLDNKKLDFAELGSLTFEKPDMDKFPCLALAFEAIGRGGNIPCAMNAANEAAVAAFLQDRIRFYDIPDIISSCMAGVEFVSAPGIDELISMNDEVYRKAAELCNVHGK